MSHGPTPEHQTSPWEPAERRGNRATPNHTVTWSVCVFAATDLISYLPPTHPATYPATHAATQLEGGLGRSVSAVAERAHRKLFAGGPWAQTLPPPPPPPTPTQPMRIQKMEAHTSYVRGVLDEARGVVGVGRAEHRELGEGGQGRAGSVVGLVQVPVITPLVVSGARAHAPDS